MQKACLSLLLILLTVSPLVGACACAASKAPEVVKPCEVRLSEIIPIVIGDKEAAFRVTFLVRNPNQSMVKLTELNYALTNEDDPLGTGATSSEVYVPGGFEVKVPTTVPATITNVVGRFMMQYPLMSPADAQKRGIALWIRLKEDKGTWCAKGVAYFESASGPMAPVPFEEQYSIK